MGNLRSAKGFEKVGVVALITDDTKVIEKAKAWCCPAWARSGCYDGLVSG